jgi:hypothetical protein
VTRGERFAWRRTEKRRTDASLDEGLIINY